MKFAWDERKNNANIAKHGLDFSDVESIFQGFVLAKPDLRFAYGDDRWIGVGTIGSRIVVIVYTLEGGDTIRVISLRKALTHERAEYEKALQDRLGPS